MNELFLVEPTVMKILVGYVVVAVVLLLFGGSLGQNFYNLFNGLAKVAILLLASIAFLSKAHSLEPVKIWLGLVLILFILVGFEVVAVFERQVREYRERT